MQNNPLLIQNTSDFDDCYGPDVIQAPVFYGDFKPLDGKTLISDISSAIEKLRNQIISYS
jgi:hypothetical protein